MLAAALIDIPVISVASVLFVFHPAVALANRNDGILMAQPIDVELVNLATNPDVPPDIGIKIPEVPDVPYDPDEPELPLEPEVPDEPELPLDPDEPELPLDPDEPEVPELP